MTIYKLAAPALALAILTGCRDDFMGDMPHPGNENQIAADITACGLDCKLNVAQELGHQADNISVAEGDFIFVLPDGSLYLEQNDDGSPRIAVIEYTDSEQHRQRASICQRRAADAAPAERRRNFLRSYGVGYSYDAVSGDYCNTADIKGQVLNRAVIESITQEQMFNVDYIERMRATGYTSTSLVSYSHNSNFTANGETGCLLYKGSVSKTCHLFEDADVDTYIVHNEVEKTVSRQILDWRSVLEYIDDYPMILTSSFRNSVDRLAKDPDNVLALDSFINRFGTHVVYEAELGAKITLDIRSERKLFDMKSDETLLEEHAISTLFNQHKSESESKRIRRLIDEAQCSFDITGGDAATMESVVNTTKLSSGTNFSSTLLTAWIQSVTFHDDDPSRNNVELTDMEVFPIWKLVTDPVVATRLEARIMGNAASYQEIYGNRNFINTSFPAVFPSVSCRVGNSRQTFQNPLTVDIICANRHVATVCREIVPEIDTETPVCVAYPIYEGRVQLTDGLCAWNGKIYRVDWRYGSFAVAEIGDAPADTSTIYMNGGALSFLKNEHAAYQTAFAVIGSERPGGININGSLGGYLTKVFKHFGHFYLDTDHTGAISNLPGWSYTTSIPAEASEYPEYLGNAYRNRMVRDDDYVYVYNSTEIGQ